MPYINRQPFSRIPFARQPLISALLLSSAILFSASLHADETDAEPSAPSADQQQAQPSDADSDSAQQNWLENTRAACVQQYSAEQCADPEFFEEHFHAGDLQTAHRAAIRRNDMEQRALRELMLQRSCDNSAAFCRDGAADCAAQLQQMCSTIKKEAASCVTQAAQYCTTTGQGSDCLKQRQTLCPSVKKQTVDKLLAKYPKLTAAQQAHVRQVAKQMDAKDSSWIGNLFRWLGF